MEEERIFKNQEIELFTRKEVSNLLKIAVSHVDLIPETELPRVHIGKSIRFRLSSLQKFINMKEVKNEII